MSHAIISYPISSNFQSKLEQLVGKPIEYLLLSDLRKLSFFNFLKKMRKLKTESLFLPLEDVNSIALLPILTTVAAIAKTKSIEIIYPDFKRKKTTKWQSGIVLFKLAATSLAALITLFYSKIQIKKLFYAKKINAVLNKNTSNILYLNTNLWFGIKAGGSVGHIAGVVNALALQGFQTYYASVGEKTLIDPKINFTLIHPLKSFGIPAELNYYLFNQKIIRQLKKQYKNLPLKFIYQRLSIANYTGVMLSRSLKVPLILEYNGSEAWVAKNWGKTLRFHGEAVMAEDVCLKHASLIVTISNVLKEELITRGVEPDKIVYYPNCINPKIFNPDNFSSQLCFDLRKRYQISSDAILLTFVGTFGAWHGVDILAKTIRKLIDQDENWLIKNKIHFMLVGDGLKMPEVKAILRDHKCKPFVTFTGLIPQEEAPGYLAMSEILLSPHIPNADGSRFFGSPTKLFEYMAMGKAILASNLEQIGDILKNSLHASNLASLQNDDNTSKLAVLCKPGSIGELITGIRFLVEQPGLRIQLGQNARKEVLAKYTWEKHVSAFLEKIE